VRDRIKATIEGMLVNYYMNLVLDQEERAFASN